MLSFFLIWLILIDESWWITTNPALTLYKIHRQRQSKGKPAKAEVMVYL
jgi:hypothetical protein